MEREKVESSNLVSIGYDASKRILEVEFKGGGLYTYSQVPEEVYTDLMRSSSKGKFFAAVIRPVYRGEKCTKI